MNSTETRKPGHQAGPAPEPVSPATRRQRWALAVPAAGLVFSAVVLFRSYAFSWDLSDLSLVLFWQWTAGPFLLIGVLVWLAAGRTRLGWWLALALGVVITASSVWGYVDYRTSDSSTAALGFLFAPLWQLCIVAAVGAVILALCFPQRRARTPVAESSNSPSIQVSHRSDAGGAD